MLPPVILPVADINPAVSKLPPVMLAVTETVVPVWVVALTLAPPKMLPPVILPTALMPSLDVQTLAVLLYNQVIYGLPIGPTSIPPPFAALALIALLA